MSRPQAPPHHRLMPRISEVKPDDGLHDRHSQVKLNTRAEIMVENSIERLASSLSGRYAIRLTGEAVQSAYHFILNILLIRVFAPNEYGVFAIVFMIGVIANLYSNALFAIPAALYMPRKCGASARLLDVTLGSMALIGCIALSVVIACGVWVWLGSLFSGVFAGSFVGLWALRNYTRAVVLTRRDANGAISATLSDVCYALFGTALALRDPRLPRACRSPPVPSSSV